MVINLINTSSESDSVDEMKEESDFGKTHNHLDTSTNCLGHAGDHKHLVN